ncbi:MAG: polyphenol oxidase family protein, partial [Rickettsiales bacterium]
MAEFLQSEALSSLSGIRHGFFTRKGGVSEGIYASLNVGPGSDDVAEHVVENRHRVAEAMGVIPERLCSLYQIHSDKVVTLRGPFDEGEKPEGDAMVTNIRGLALGILTADCAPVLFADETAKVIGVAHAGWPGALIDIPSRTVEAMERLGAKREQIIAVIGPCIHQESYEVDAGFRERFMQQS